mgnify:FL=1
MEYIIGRDAQTRQLAVSVNGQVKRIGQPGCVPMDVSRQHLSLSSLGGGQWQLKNLNAQNVTFVNGLAVELKNITEADKVELGQSHYLFPWDAVREPKVETIDIRPLRNVWKDYEKQQLELQIAERKFNAARSAVGIITMLAIACSIILGHTTIYLVLYALAIGISVAFAIQAYNKAQEVPRLQQDMKKRFQRNYVCPKCGHFMGFQDYDIISQNEACPYCKTKYKK